MLKHPLLVCGPWVVVRNVEGAQTRVKMSTCALGARQRQLTWQWPTVAQVDMLKPCVSYPVPRLQVSTEKRQITHTYPIGTSVPNVLHSLQP